MGWGALGTPRLPCLAAGGLSLSFALFHFPVVFCFSQAQKSHWVSVLSFQGLCAFWCDLENVLWANPFPPWGSAGSAEFNSSCVLGRGISSCRWRAEGRGKLNHRDVSLKGIGKQGLNLDYVWRCGSCPKPTLQGQAGGEDYAGCGEQSTQKQIYTHTYTASQ